MDGLGRALKRIEWNYFTWLVLVEFGYVAKVEELCKEFLFVALKVVSLPWQETDVYIEI